MIRFAAINAGDSDKEESDITVSVEALEAANFRSYEKALRAQQRENYLEAQQFYHDILNSSLLTTASGDAAGTSSAMTMLKYSTLKNLATISELVDDRERALNFFTRAVDIDASDLLVWYHIGRLAGELQRWNIARLSFERALQLSPSHWMTLERLSELLYIIGDNQSCMNIVKQARQIDSANSRVYLLEQLLLIETKEHSSNSSDTNSHSNNIRNIIANNENAVSYMKKLIAKREKTMLNRDANRDPTASAKIFAEFVNEKKEYELSKPTWDSLHSLLLSIYKDKVNTSIDIDGDTDDDKDETKKKTNLFRLYKPLEILLESKPITPILTPNTIQQDQQKPADDIVKAVFGLDKLQQDVNNDKDKDKDIIMLDNNNNNTVTPSTTNNNSESTANSNSTSLNSSSSGVNNTSLSVKDNSTTTPATTTATTTSTTSQIVAKRRAARNVANKYDDKAQEMEDFGEKSLKVTKLLNSDVMASLNFMSESIENDADGSLQKSPKDQLQQNQLLHETQSKMDIETNQSFEKNIVYQFIKSINQSESKYTIIDWFISYLNKITTAHQQQFHIELSLISKLINMSKIISKYNSNFHKYQLFFAEIAFDYHLSKLEQSITAQQPSTKRQRKDDSHMNDAAIQTLDLSYSIQLLNSNRGRFADDTYYCIRYYWLLARYTKFLGDINLASVYFFNCDELFKQWIIHNPSALIILHHCKNDRFISKSSLSERIETLQDQQEKNRASQLFASGEFAKVISILDPLFPDAFCLFDPTATQTTEFKSCEIIDTKVRSKLNMIEYLLQSYLSTSNTKGVYKMSIYLLKELTTNYNENMVNSTYETLYKVFTHSNMKPEMLEEPLSTLSSILTKLLYRHFKKNMLYEWLNLFMKVYQFDLNTQLSISNKLALFSGYHSDLAKKKQCMSASNDKFLLDYLEMSLRFIINQDNEINPADFNETKLEIAILKIFTDISQCFHCLYSIKLTNNVEDHQCQTSLGLDSPNLYVQIYYIIKIISGEEEEINLPLNGQVNQAISSLHSIASKKDYKDLVEKLYTKFPEPPERVTRYKSTINNYFDSQSDEIVEFPESVSPPRVNFEIQLFNHDQELSLADPLFDDVYTDIYYMYASTLANDKHLNLKEELLKKDLYSNPNRILSWTLLSKIFQSEVTTITAEKGCLCQNDSELQQEIWTLYAKLRLIYKHLASLTPKEDIYRYLGLLMYEQHYFASKEIANDPDKLNPLFKEAQKYFEQAEKLATNDMWYYPLYYGKISLKLGNSLQVYFDYLWQSVQLLPPLNKKNPPIDPLYRLHASRLKLLLPYSDNSLNDSLLTLLEKFNFTPTTSSTSKENDGDENMTDVAIEDKSVETQVEPVIPLEVRRENLIDNSLAALNCCKSLVSYHHQSSYRVAWTIRYQTTKEDYISNSLKEFMRLMKPKLSRLSRAAVWSLWNEGYLGDGKLDRYFKKYYRFFIQLLHENNDYTNLDVVHAKLKQEEKFKEEAILCYDACCQALQNQFEQLQNQQKNSTAPPLSANTNSTQSTQLPVAETVQSTNQTTMGSPPTSPPPSTTTNIQPTNNVTDGNIPATSPNSTTVLTTSTFVPTPTPAPAPVATPISPEEAKQTKLLQSLWELYTDIALYPEHKELLYDLMRKSHQLTTHPSPNKDKDKDQDGGTISDEKLIEFYEKKFSLKDKRKKK